VGTVVTVYLPDKLPDARLARGGEV